MRSLKYKYSKIFLIEFRRTLLSPCIDTKRIEQRLNNNSNNRRSIFFSSSNLPVWLFELLRSVGISEISSLRFFLRFAQFLTWSLALSLALFFLLVVHILISLYPVLSFLFSHSVLISPSNVQGEKFHPYFIMSSRKHEKVEINRLKIWSIVDQFLSFSFLLRVFLFGSPQRSTNRTVYFFCQCHLI